MTEFRRMTDIPFASRRTLCRGYVTCGRCGTTKWNPRDHEITWLKIPLPDVMSIRDKRLMTAIPAFDLYRGIDIPHIYVRRTRETGPISKFSSFRSCLCENFLASARPVPPIRTQYRRLVRTPRHRGRTETARSALPIPCPCARKPT